MRSIFEGQFLIETKYDGERVQCHLDETSLKLFSRNCHDVTDIYGPALSDFIRDAVNAKAIILDGEIVVVDRASHAPAPFGKNKQVALEEAKLSISASLTQENSSNSQYQLCCKLGLSQTTCSM